MGFFSDIGGAIGGAFGLGGIGSSVGSFLDGNAGSIASGALGYAGQQDTNSANAAIHSSDNAFNAQQADINRTWSADQAAKQMAYQTDMSNSQWQRGVADMQAAGLSPMLAYMKGGASSPSGAMGSSSVASSASPISMGNSFAAGVSSANSAADTSLKSSQSSLNSAQISLVESNVSQIKAQTDKIVGDTNFDTQQLILKRSAELLMQQASSLSQDLPNKAVQYEVLQATASKIVSETKLNALDLDAAAKMGNFGRDMGQLKPFLDLILGAIRSSRGR